MDGLTLAGATAAFVAGATGSLHCALMCGPLACAASAGSARSAASWHVSRVLAYAAVGALLGATGVAALAVLPDARPVLPWVMAAALVATALDVGRHLKPLPIVRRVSAFLVKRSAAFAPVVRAGAIGAATPFLPCGLVYGLAMAALAAGSARGGAVVMAAFALGAVPALVAAQVQLGVLKKNARVFAVLRRAVPLAAAVVLVWRALAAGTGEGAPVCR